MVGSLSENETTAIAEPRSQDEDYNGYLGKGVKLMTKSMFAILASIPVIQ
jgi:hypothetical protein